MFDGPTECTSKKSFTNPVCVCFTPTFAYHHYFIALEYDLHAEEKRHDQIQATHNSESRAEEILAIAARFMNACQGSMQEGYSRYGSFHSLFSLYIIY